MNVITLPIIITIAVLGIIAIILVKLFYKDKKVSDLSDELAPIVNKHWSKLDEENDMETKTSDEYAFVSKSWEEPMGQKQELKNGVASKVFQEPMHSKYQDMISSESKDNNAKFIELNDNLTTNDSSFDDLNTALNNFDTGNQDDFDSFDNYKNGEFDEHFDKQKSNNIDLKENDDGSFKISKSDSNSLNESYITPKQYYSNTDNNNNINNDNNNENEEPENIEQRDEINKKNIDNFRETDKEYYKEYDTNSDKSSNTKNIPENYNSYEKNEPLNYKEVLDVSEQVIVGGNPCSIKVGDDIIFNYNGENYSSTILEIKHENIRVKYRSQEKWISFSDIKKVF
jgi:hypothetical protein